MTTTAERIAQTRNPSIAADAEAVDRDQDWEHEATTYQFADGSALRVSGMDANVLHDYTEFVDVGPSLGDYETPEQYARECELLDDCYTRACEGTPYTILARPARQGEASGTYAETNYGLQILGYTIPMPEEVAEIIREAWDDYYALPRDEDEPA